jgi:hypothetical protein
VHPVLADEPRLRATLARLRVRYAALTPEFEREYAARLPAGRLPAWFREVAADDTTGIRIFEVRPE